MHHAACADKTMAHSGLMASKTLVAQMMDPGKVHRGLDSQGSLPSISDLENPQD